MKTSLPFKYIVSIKRGKYYVVFDFKDNNEKVDEMIAQFYKEYCSGKVTKPKKK